MSIFFLAETYLPEGPLKFVPRPNRVAVDGDGNSAVGDKLDAFAY